MLARNRSDSHAFLNFSTIRVGFFSPFTILVSDFLGGEIAAVTAVVEVVSEIAVAAEEKRRIEKVLKVPRRMRDRDDIVLVVCKRVSGDGFKKQNQDASIIFT